MAKIIKNTLGNFLIICFIFLTVIVWIFTGWPQIWKKPAFPPKIQEAWAGDQTFTSTGTWDAPAGVSSVQVECWGGGGAGGGSSNTSISSGGGGGGEYSICDIAVTGGKPGYDVTIGAGGTPSAGSNGGNGGNSSFVGDAAETCSANGGGGGAGGTGTTAGTGGTGGTGDTSYTGGPGGTGYSGAGGGAGGGSSAGTGAIGNAGGNGTAGGPGAGGTAPTGGGIGGVGGADHNNGVAPVSGNGGGGGGSGAKTGGNESGGAGAGGKCILTWTVGAIYSVSITTGSVTYGTVALGATNDTIATGETQIAENNGNTAAKFSIKGTNSADWTLQGTPSGDQYRHRFATPANTWTTLTLNYQTLIASIAQDATQGFDLEVLISSDTTIEAQQNVDVYIQAAAP